MNVRRVLASTAATLMVPASLTLVPVKVSALSCAPPPDLSFKEMIRRTRRFDRFLGKVIRIKDVDPGKGGDKIAKLAVAASPVGWAPLVTRIPFWIPEPADPGEPQVSDDYGINYQRHDWYAVVAHRTRSGLFADDSVCGNSRRMTYRPLLATDPLRPGPLTLRNMWALCAVTRCNRDSLRVTARHAESVRLCKRAQFFNMLMPLVNSGLMNTAKISGKMIRTNPVGCGASTVRVIREPRPATSTSNWCT